MSKLGVEYPLQSLINQEKAKQTITERYGVDNRSQIHFVDILPLIDSKDWMANEYTTQKKTMSQIAAELGISVNTICVYLRKHHIPIRPMDKHSYKCLCWLESISKEETIYIQCARTGGEFKIPDTQYHADGYCAETNTIYEFHGDYWHGNPKIYAPELINEVSKKTMGELYQATLSKENRIKDLGYNLIVMWERDWNLLKLR